MAAARALTTLEILDRYGSLGPDFLTWLAVHAGEEGFAGTPSEPGLMVTVLGPMVFQSDTGEATKMSLAGDEAASAPEVLAALRAGKRLTRAKLQLNAQDAEWVLTLDGETFDFRGLKLPVPKVADLDEYLSLRIQATQHLDLLIRELFEKFLAVRLDPAAWKDEAKSWSKGR